MNKNLKKVISAVAVLAMSASSFVAFAANYPDVDASASYKQAVDELSALEVINGYEDGTFRPDELVTRAEFSKMVITALGSAELAQAEAAAGRDTQFTDVTGSHWAAGYVTAAVSQSIINGMGDGTFAPDANVTYAQAMKMLVCAAGYEQWSMDQGGWPDGYMYWGNQLKVGNGVKDVTDTTEITRAQVAQMIDNVIDAPVCVDTHKYNFDRYGNQYAELEQMNGTGRDFESILTRNHDTYKVRGTVTATSRSGSEVSNIDEIKFEIQNAKKWLDETQAITRKDSVEITANVGDTNVADYLKQYVEVMVREDDDDEYTILSVATAGQTDENVEAADDYDAARSTDEKMYFYTNGKQKSYKINDDTELYVNGVSVGSGDDFAAGIATYVEGNTASDVTLIDVPDSGASTDGVIDLVYVNYYATAIVDSVTGADSDNPEVVFMDNTSNASSTMEFDLTARDMSYTIVDTEGNAVELADLAEYDVLSIQYDVTAGDTQRNAFRDSSFYDVIVSKATDEGKVTTYNREDDEYDINGTTYSVVAVGDDAMVSGLDMNVTYTLYLDAFGRIAYVDETAVDKKIAILDAVYTVRGSETEVSLILKDGSTEAYLLRDVAGNDTLAKSIVYADGTGDDKTKKEVYDRVIEYTLNSANELTVKKALTGTSVGYTNNGLFRASVSRLGGVQISEDTTTLLNAAEVVGGKKGDITAMSYSSLVDERDYQAYAFDRANDGTYRFVIITNGSGSYSPDTQLAVYKRTLETQNDNNDSVTAFVVLVEGAEKTINIADEYNAPNLVAGQPIVYETNSSGEITKVDDVLASTFSATPGSTYNALREAALGTDGATNGILKSGLDTLLSSNNDDVEVVFGPVVGKTATSITLATAANGTSSVNDDEVYVYDNDVKVYVYDSEETRGVNAVSVGAAGDVVAQRVNNSMYVDADRTNYNWFYGDNDEILVKPSFAIIRTVNDTVKEVYVITANNRD